MEMTAAVEADLPELRSIAHDSEAYWGCGQDFMDKFDRVFNITGDFIVDNAVYTGRIGGKIVAFWGLKKMGLTAELEYFYVSRDCIGMGLGKCLWYSLITWCIGKQVKKLTFVTSEQAVGFYEKMGARRCGEAVSEIDGRLIPRLIYETECFEIHSCHQPSTAQLSEVSLM